MSGESRLDDANDWAWAHILWQRRGIRLEEFADMPRNLQLAYIASEQLANERPQSSIDRYVKARFKRR